MLSSNPRLFQRLEGRCLLAADFVSADFNRDRIVDGQDLDEMVSAIQGQENDARYDLNIDAIVDSRDLDTLVEDVLGTRRGDTNLDGDVDFRDFLTLSSNFGTKGGWVAGEADLEVGISFGDFLVMSTHFGFRKTTVSYTNHATDGNRFVRGWGKVPDSIPIDIALPFVPEWVLGSPLGDRQIWVAVSKGGDILGFELAEKEVRPIAVEHVGLVPGMPPALQVDRSGVRIISRPPEASTTSHPIRFGIDLERQAYVHQNGDLIVTEETGVQNSVSVNAMLDSRILADASGRLLVLTDPTTSLRHGVLGDGIEANSVTLVDTTTAPWSVSKIDTPAGKVIEGIAPIWTDIYGDDRPEIILTLSSSTNGGQLVVYNEDGSVALEEPGIGRGSRWRHQIAVAPFAPSGEIEFVDVLTPHIGGVVEFRALEPSLPVVGQVSGSTSHTIRSRNLDLAVAGDFDSDGSVEILLPSQRREQLRGISRNVDGASLDWQVAVGGVMSTNVAVMQGLGGSLIVGFGRTDGTLRVLV